jgi:hypothetical protein
MGPFVGTIIVMKHKNSHLLIGYWSRLRRGRAVPDQTDIDPKSIKRLLPYAFILDATNPDHPTYRLAGTGLCERFGFELKGTSFLGQWEAQSDIALTSLLRQALKTKKPVSISSVATTAECGMIELETVLAPISFNGAEPTRFIGMVQLLTDVVALGGKPIAFQRMVASQLVSEGEPLSTYSHFPPPPPPAPALRTHTRAPYLRLVSSLDKPERGPVTLH